ncbi:hypothetical protein CRM22_008943 [Opisthorchis felineus]|uniref:Uncharacterized protein n=1 Tax=Opisthorchis felineus TaxID=147828 RepID=A0A4S2LFX9_OPIFE|nr:hypothetical protein CRM22_008943 [Opisthorchis felineus]
MDPDEKNRFLAHSIKFMKKVVNAAGLTAVSRNFNRTLNEFSKIGSVLQSAACCRQICIACFRRSQPTDKRIFVNKRKRTHGRKRHGLNQYVECRHCGCKQLMPDFRPSDYSADPLKTPQRHLNVVPNSRSLKKKKKREQISVYKTESPCVKTPLQKAKKRKSAMQGVLALLS